MKRSLQSICLLLTAVLLAGVTFTGVRAQAKIYTVAGTNFTTGGAGDGGPATSATFNLPQQVATDARGNIYINDGGYVIRKVDSLGIITRYAGSAPGDPNGSGDGGPAIDAILGNIIYMVSDTAGNLYLLGLNNSYNSIRKVDVKTGIITTITSTDGTQPFAAGNLAKNARYLSNSPFVADNSGNLYVVDAEVSGAIIFKIDAAGMISVFRDLTGQLYEDGTPADLGYYMNDLAFGKDGSMYIDDWNHSCIYKLSKDGDYSRVAGIFFNFDFFGDGGPATSASLLLPYSLSVDTVANTYFILDQGNQRIRKVDALGTITTFVGGGSSVDDGVYATDASVGQPQFMRQDRDGNLLFIDQGPNVVRLVGKRIIRTKFDSIPRKTYGDGDFTLNAIASNAVSPVFSSDKPGVLSIGGDGKVHVAGAGTVTLTASFPATAIDVALTVSQTITVAKKELTVTADDQSRMVGEANPVLTFQYSGFVNGETEAALTTQPQTMTGATVVSPGGQYPITISGGQSDNYSFNYVSGTLTVSQPTQLPQTITFDVLPGKAYGDADFDPGATSDNTTIPVQYSSNNAGVATIVNGQVHIVGIGSTTITASQPGNGVYAPAKSVMQTLTVGKATVTITADDKTTTYGSALPSFTLTYSGWAYNDGPSVLTSVPTAGTTAVAGSPVGLYPITVSGAAAANYLFVYTAGTLTIAAQAQTITFNALPVKLYSDGDFTPVAVSSNVDVPVTYSSGDPTVATITAGGFIHITGVGTATIIASQASSGNYGAAPDVSQVLTVNAGLLTIAPDDQLRVQGKPNETFAFNYAGLKEGETPADVLLTAPMATTMANTDSYPGIYPVTASGANVNSHYTITYRTGTLTIVVDSTQAGGGDRLDTWSSSPSTLEVEVFALAGQHAAIQVYSLYGQVAVNKEVYLVNADNHFTLPVANLTPGLYVVKVMGQYMKLSQKVRIVR